MLCQRCFLDREIRELYPMSPGGYGHQPVIFSLMQTEAGCGPTDALPGTEDKIDVMQARARKRLPLFHPQDATLEMAVAWLRELAAAS